MFGGRRRIWLAHSRGGVQQRTLSVHGDKLEKYFPTGAAKQTGVHFGANIAPKPDYQFYGKAHGGYGYRVSEPGQIKTAVENALRHEAERKLTVIDLVLSDFNPR